MPSHPPGTPIGVGQERDLVQLEQLEAFGFEEGWIGEHFTAAWEPCPAPDLLIAAAAHRTRRIRLGSLGHLLPYHNPIALAHRLAYLGLGLGKLLKTDAAMPDSAVDLPYLAENVWLVSSPDTVAAKIRHLQTRTGGFGTFVATLYGDETSSLRLLADEVRPRCGANLSAPVLESAGA